MNRDKQADCTKHAEAISLLAISFPATGSLGGGEHSQIEVDSDDLRGAERHLAGCAECSQRYRQLVKLADSLAFVVFRSGERDEAGPKWLDDASSSVLGRLSLDGQDGAEAGIGGGIEDRNDCVVKSFAAREVSARRSVPVADSQRRQAAAGVFDWGNSRKFGESRDGDSQGASRVRGVRIWLVMTSAVVATAAACWLIGWFANQLGIFPSAKLPAQNEVANAGGADSGGNLSDVVAQAGVTEADVSSVELLRDRTVDLIGQKESESVGSGTAKPGIATMWELRQSLVGLEGDFEKVLARGRSGGNSGSEVLRALARELMQ